MLTLFFISLGFLLLLMAGKFYEMRSGRRMILVDFRRRADRVVLENYRRAVNSLRAGVYRTKQYLRNLAQSIRSWLSNLFADLADRLR